MKKIVYFLLVALCLPLGLSAQNAGDDLYFVPSKDKQEKKETPVRKESKKQVTTNIYTSPGTTVVVQDRKGRTRDVDEYNRRYDAKSNEFVMENDTLYIKEKSKPDLEGEWVTGEFNGTEEDYDYAERIIRFRNPRFAISVSSPLYWDVVYGPNSWDWNVYTDGMYAYAFPTFSNPMWWDWRYGSFGSYGWGWNSGWGWNRPYYSWGYSPGYWGGFYGGGYWGHYHHPHYGYYNGGGYGWGGGRNSNMMYTDRRSPRYNDRSTNNGRYTSNRYQSSRTSDRYQSSRSSSDRTVPGRVVGTRDNNREKTSIGNRVDNTYRRDTYTRPSSTRTNTSRSGGSTYEGRNSSTRTSSGRSESSYNRGTSSRTYERSSGSSSRESYTPSSNRSTNSYSPSSGSSRGSSYSSGSNSGGSSRGSSGGGGSARGSSSRR